MKGSGIVAAARVAGSHESEDAAAVGDVEPEAHTDSEPEVEPEAGPEAQAEPEPEVEAEAEAERRT